MDKKGSKLNGILFFLAYLVLVGATFYYAKKHTDWWLPPLASEHGAVVDQLFNVTMWVTGIVFLITQFGLVYFVMIYSGKKQSEKAHWYPENHSLEWAWTITPAIIMTALIVMGARGWANIEMSEPPKDAFQVEVTGQQFNWIIRYPGKDGIFGKLDPKLINGNDISSNNALGLDMSDPNAKDDIISAELYVPKDRPVWVRIHAKDVLHSFYLPHFRVKQDGVPGMETKFWFKPTKTTDEMKKELKNDKFEYEFACAEVCGLGHFKMKGFIQCLSQEEVNSWLAEQDTTTRAEIMLQ